MGCAFNPVYCYGAFTATNLIINTLKFYMLLNF